MMFRYHHLHLICSGLEEMISFFTKVLGAKLVVRRKFGTADGATLDLNGALINLRVAREEENIVEDAARGRFGYDHLGLQVEDLDATCEQLLEKGFTFTVPPTDSGNVRFAFFKGPDQITLELVQVLS